MTNPSFSEVTVSKYADDSSAGALKFNINGTYFNPISNGKSSISKAASISDSMGPFLVNGVKRLPRKIVGSTIAAQRTASLLLSKETSSIGLEASVDILDDNAFKESPRSHFVVDAI